MYSVSGAALPDLVVDLGLALESAFKMSPTTVLMGELGGPQASPSPLCIPVCYGALEERASQTGFLARNPGEVVHSFFHSQMLTGAKCQGLG